MLRGCRLRRRNTRKCEGWYADRLWAGRNARFWARAAGSPLGIGSARRRTSLVRAARATIKIYDTRDSGTPRLTISGETVAPTLAMLRNCKKAGRDLIQAYLTGAIANISPARGDHLRLTPEEYRRRYEAANSEIRRQIEKPKKPKPSPLAGC